MSNPMNTGEWVIEFHKQGTFLAATSDVAALDAAQRFASKAEAEAFMADHAWIADRHGAPITVDQVRTREAHYPNETAEVRMENTIVPITIELTERMIHDHVVSGIEGGGVGYWCTVDAGEHEPGWRNYFTAKFTVTEPGDDRAVCGQTYELSLDKLKAGLAVLARNYAHHFGDILKEDGDATTGDVLIQCALFGDIIFG